MRSPSALECVISGAERCFTAALAVDQPRKPDAALRSLAVAKSKAASDRHPIRGLLRRQLGARGTGVELGIADSASHRGSRFPKISPKTCMRTRADTQGLTLANSLTF